MILYYAIGGGLGHLTRARAVAHTLGFNDRIAVLTASQFSSDPRVTAGLEIIKVPRCFERNLAEYRHWLQTLLCRLQPTDFYLDTFPAGIIGEFCNFSFPSGVSLHYIARLLRFARYEDEMIGAPPAFKRTYVLEQLGELQYHFVSDASVETLPLILIDPPMVPDVETDRAIRIVEQSGPFWVVVHSGPPQEVQQLIQYARELRSSEGSEAAIVVVSPRGQQTIAVVEDGARDREVCAHLHLYPARVLFQSARRIITACGFNVMRETEEFAEKHRFVPFERRFDDQFLRARRRRGGGRGEGAKGRRGC